MTLTILFECRNLTSKKQKHTESNSSKVLSQVKAASFLNPTPKQRTLDWVSANLSIIEPNLNGIQYNLK